jgi:hypothetical protein
MSAETQRARELLVSSEELLERSRNRPRYSSSWIDEQPECRAVVTAPVVRKVRRDAAVSQTMDPQTQAAWGRWAESIARKVAQEQDLKLVDVIGEALKVVLAERDERIAALEQRVDQLEQQASGKVSPIRSAAA